MNENIWIANGIRFNDAGHLVINADPAYGNRKKWEGEMEFYLETGVLAQLKQHIEDCKTKERMLEVAADEMVEFCESFKTAYHEKKQYLAQQLNLAVDDIPKPHWWTMEATDEAVSVHRKDW